jgi:hypothetical protein
MNSSLAFTISLLGCLAIGAWLVISGHPWFGLLVIAIGASVQVTTTTKK